MSQRIHILGICGTFMGGVALLARSHGSQVSGSDSGVYPPMSTMLKAAGIKVLDGYQPGHLQPPPDLVVIGNALSRGNPAVEYVLNQGLPYTSGPQWLFDAVLRDRHVLAVAGTHGKTSTSAMLAHILDYAGVKPGFLIGGLPANFGESARLGAGNPFVVEADEYDSAFFDKRSKFVHYRPRTLILNNLEFDHADIFEDLAAIQRQFHHLVRCVPGEGLIVRNAQAPALDAVLKRGCWTPLESFAPDAGQWQARKQDAAGHRFEVVFESEPVGKVNWQQGGDYNISNALAAIAAARHADVAPATACDALASYQGVARRMEQVAAVSDIRLFDDFAHHPTAITATLAAARDAHAGHRLIAVTEPRSNTLKMGVGKQDWARALAGADQVFVYADPELSWSPKDSLEQAGVTQATVLPEIDTLVAAVGQAARPGDRVVIMSNGGFGGLRGKLAERLHHLHGDV